jgi:hypothetical protein
MTIDYKIPTFINVKYVQDDGYLTSDMQIYNDTLNRFLQDNLSGNGWRLPQVTQADLAALMALTGDQLPPDGTMWYCTDVVPPRLVVKISNVLRSVSDAVFP